MNCERCEKVGLDKCSCKKTYVFYQCITFRCDNSVWPVSLEQIEDGEGVLECEICGKECVRTTASPTTYIYPGNEVTFDHPDNPNARWGRIIATDDLNEVGNIGLIHVANIGTGKIAEIRGLRR